MKRKAYQVAVPVVLVFAMVAFLSTIFFNANPSFAAAEKKKSSVVGKVSAVDHTEARIKEMQEALKITEVQKGLWNDLAGAMRENAKEMDAITKDRAENAKTMNAVERMKFHGLITEAQLGQLKKVIPPFEALYAAMSDEQKKVADTIFRTGRHGKSKRK